MEIPKNIKITNQDEEARQTKNSSELIDDGVLHEIMITTRNVRQIIHK